MERPLQGWGANWEHQGGSGLCTTPGLSSSSCLLLRWAAPCYGHPLGAKMPWLNAWNRVAWPREEQGGEEERHLQRGGESQAVLTHG